jgi:hypothetical protein
MRIVRLAVLFVPAATAAFAQQWEFGAVGGGGFFNHVSAAAPAGGATAGFAPGFAAGVFLRENMNRFVHLSGELRYEYLQSDMRLSAGGQTAQFNGNSQAIHYDLIYHNNPKESRLQFFGAAGGGVKAFFGTGSQEAYQPLSQYGYFTQTKAAKPMISAGGGFTYQLGPHLIFRAEVRDFITGFPTAVLTPPTGVKYGTWLNDIVPMVGISWVKKSAQTEPPPSVAPAVKP